MESFLAENGESILGLLKLLVPILAAGIVVWSIRVLLLYKQLKHQKDRLSFEKVRVEIQRDQVALERSRLELQRECLKRNLLPPGY